MLKKSKSVLLKMILLIFAVSLLSGNVYSASGKQLTEKQIAKKRKLMVKIQKMRKAQIEAKIETQKKLDALDAKDRDSRKSAIKSYEKYIKRMGSKSNPKVGDALFQLGQL